MGIEEVYEEARGKRGTTSSGREVIVLPSRVLAAYPGNYVRFGVKLTGPVGHRLRVYVEKLPAGVATVSLSPEESVAPFTLSIDIHVKPGAPPGTYTFELRAIDMATGILIGSRILTLIVLRRGIPKSLTKHYQRLRTLYLAYGAQALIWYILAQILRNGASFSQIKYIYEVTTNKRVSNGTIGNVLKRLLRKRIIAEKSPGIYVANVKDFNILLSRIDLSRVRVQTNTGRKNTKRDVNTLGKINATGFTRLPKPIKRVWQRAKEIANKHGALTALYFLLHTLLGAEATGHLLYWLNNWFIVCRSKTGLCYHFYSELLHEMLRRLGLREGIQYNYFDKQMHREARKIAQQYIRKYYHSHPAARRLHYMLKKLGYIEYDNDVYTLKILYYPDNKIGLEIYDDRGEELLYSDSVRKDYRPKRVKVKSALPFEHVDEENEETYFSRPSGLY